MLAVDTRDETVEQALTSRTDDIIRRYVRKHGLDASNPVTTDMVRTHFYTERRLAQSILAARREERGLAAERAYTAFYTECFWLDAWHRDENEQEEYLSFAPFLHLLKGRGREVYEVGSGSGRLATFLTKHGFNCIATDISIERQARANDGKGGLVWHVSDGIRLANYEPASHFDSVISSQVIEHLHPEDVHEHFAHARTILKPGGAYVFNTPHRFSGPKDISEIFGMVRSDCFHLKEYTYEELSTIARESGFREVKATYVVPRRIRAKFNGKLDRPMVSSLYLRALIAAEAVLGRIDHKARKHLIRLAEAGALWRPEVFIVAVK